MKTKEFIKKVKELGFEIIRAGSHIDINYFDKTDTVFLTLKWGD